MADTTSPQDTELRQTIDQQIADLETALAISRGVAKVDEPPPDGDPFAAVLTSDVLSLIGDEIAAGRVTKSVIYFIARNSIYEMEEYLSQLRERKRQQMGEIARMPRRKAWADALASSLIKNHDAFHDAWKSIPKDDPQNGGQYARHAGYEVWREGNDLHASGPDSDECITKDSFRTGYFVRAKKA